MTRSRLAGFVPVLAFTLVCGNWANAQQPRRLPDEEVLARHNLQRRWHTQVPILKVRERITYLKVQDGLLFASSDQGMVHVLEAESGRLLWSATAGELGTAIYQPSATKQFVYVVGGEVVKQFDRGNGRLNWSKVVQSGISSGVVSNDEFLYVPTVDQRLNAIGLTDDYRRTFTKHPVVWYYFVGAPIDNPPILLKDRVIVAARDGKVYAMALDQRIVLYRYYTDSQLAAPLANWDDSLYISCVDSSIYCVNLSSGLTKWRYVTGYPISKAAIPFANDVFVVSDGAGMFCIDNNTGKPRWLNDRVVTILAASEKHVYGVDRDHNGLVIDRKDGNTIGVAAIRGFTLNAENRFNDRIYMGTQDGLIVCVAEKGSDKPYIHSLRRTKGTDDEDVAPSKDKPGKSKGFFDDVLQKGKPSNVGKISKKGGEDEPEEAPKEKKGKAKSFFDEN